MSSLAVEGNDSGTTGRAKREARLSALVADAATMWREAYGAELTDEECEDLTSKLLTAFGIELLSWRSTEPSCSADRATASGPGVVADQARLGFHSGDLIGHHQVRGERG